MVLRLNPPALKNLHLLETSSTGDLLNTEGGKLLLEVIKLLGKLGLVLVAKLVGFDGNLKRREWNKRLGKKLFEKNGILDGERNR